MIKIVSHLAPTPDMQVELRRVVRALRKARRRTTSSDSDKPSRFQIIIGDAVVSAVRAVDTETRQGKTERIEIAVSPEVLEHITRVIADSASEVLVSTRSIGEELTTQQAADLLGVSRPYLIKLLDTNKISYRRVGHYRRIQREALERYEREEQGRREAGLTELAAFTQEIGLEY